MSTHVSRDGRRQDLVRPRPGGRAETLMSPIILNEALNALHSGLEQLDYGVVCDAALYKYGNGRQPAHLDVVVPWAISHMAVPLLVSKKVGFVNVDAPGFQVGFVASDGLVYGLKIHDDRLLDVSFPAKRKTIRLGGSSARFMDMPFILNLKALQYCYRARSATREDGPQEVTSKHNQDIAFILGYMKANGIRANREQCPRVVSNGFWRRFTGNCPAQEANLRGIGLQSVAQDIDFRSILMAGHQGQSAGDASNASTPRSGSTSQSGGGNSNRSTPRTGLTSQSTSDTSNKYPTGWLSKPQQC